MKKATTLLLDGDLICYRVTASKEHPIHWGGGLWTLHSDANECYLSAAQYIETLQKLTDIDKVEIALSDKQNFRKELNPEYKANRKDVRKPLAYNALREWMEAEYPTITYPKLEADDVMGIIASDPKHNVAIISDDKDMLTVPCLMYVPKDREWLEISEEQADFNFFKQAMMGDTTDNYKGIPNVGAVTAAKILNMKDERPLWEKAYDAFIKAGLTEDDFLLNARMARILRAGEFNQKTHQIKLWNIPKHSE